MSISLTSIEVWAYNATDRSTNQWFRRCFSSMFGSRCNNWVYSTSKSDSMSNPAHIQFVRSKGLHLGQISGRYFSKVMFESAHGVNPMSQLKKNRTGARTNSKTTKLKIDVEVVWSRFRPIVLSNWKYNELFFLRGIQCFRSLGVIPSSRLVLFRKIVPYKKVICLSVFVSCVHWVR